MNTTDERVTALTRMSQKFLDPAPIEAFLRGIDRDRSPRFLVSFPRSGNGFVRYIMAKAALKANGYDISQLQQDTHDHTGKGGRAQRFIDPATGEKISIEHIIPDYHMNSADQILSIDPKFHFGGKPLTKSHFVIPDGMADYFYLYRSPLEAAVSYFNLSAKTDMVDSVIEGHHRDVFLTSIKIYLSAHAEMGRRALRHAKSGQAKLISLGHIEDGRTGSFSALVADSLDNLTTDEFETILAENHKKSGYNKALSQQLDDSIESELAAAKKVFQDLDAAHG